MAAHLQVFSEKQVNYSAMHLIQQAMRRKFDIKAKTITVSVKCC